MTLKHYSIIQKFSMYVQFMVLSVNSYSYKHYFYNRHRKYHKYGNASMTSASALYSQKRFWLLRNPLLPMMIHPLLIPLFIHWHEKCLQIYKFLIEKRDISIRNFLFSNRNLYGFINIYIFAELYIFFNKGSEFLIHM